MTELISCYPWEQLFNGLEDVFRDILVSTAVTSWSANPGALHRMVASPLSWSASSAAAASPADRRSIRRRRTSTTPRLDRDIRSPLTQLTVTVVD